MAQRERKKNPCAKCQAPYEAHAKGWHDDDCSSGLSNVPCDCAAVYVADCPGYVESRIFRASPSSVESYGGSDKKPGCPRKWASRAI